MPTSVAAILVVVFAVSYVGHLIASGGVGVAASVTGWALARWAFASMYPTAWDGSFVTTKTEPGDVDVVWDMAGVDADGLDPTFFEFDNQRAAQKRRFSAEFFPAQLVEGVTGRSFVRFFQYTREDEPVGIVVLDLKTVP